MASPLSGTVLVTGGAGFIGSALVWALNRRGYHDIIIADKLGSDEKWKNLVPLQYADYIDGDDLITILGKDPQAFGKISAVFHLGACSATTEKDSGYLMRNNFGYTKSLCNWALAQGARFVYASSAATYGDGGQGMDDKDADLAKLRPLNMYGYSKQLFDLYAQREEILGKITGLKYFNIYGPNENHKSDMRSLVNKAYDQIVETGRVQLFKSHRPDYEHGEQKRDFLYVKDAVEMTLHLAEDPGATGLYNIGSGEANTWIDLATGIFGALDKKTVIDFIDMPEVHYTCADVTKLREDTGYKTPVIPLAEAVRDYVVNYLVPGKHLGDSC